MRSRGSSSQSPELDELHAAPGNPGIAALGTCHPVRAEDGEGLLELARALAIDLVVIGPEAPLVAGIADKLRYAGVAAFGPSAGRRADRGVEGFRQGRARGSRRADRRGGSPVARPPCVVKADGLAAGKGVFVCRTQEELDAGLRGASAARRLRPDRGAARGRGAVGVRDQRRPSTRCRWRRRRTTSASATATPARTPAAWARTRRCRGRSANRRSRSSREVHRPVLAELARRGTPFTGCSTPA